MKRSIFIIAIFLCVSIFALWLLWPTAETAPFWIITEKSNSDGMNYQLDMAVQILKEKHSELEVIIEILPTEASEREIRFQQIRTQIMAGRGPDVFFLPTGDLLTMDDPVKGTTIEVSPLFSDVNQAMRNGLFADISSYYESDSEINASELNKAVMDAGCVGKARYVLPFRYSIPVIFAPSASELSDIDLSQMTAQSIVDTFLDTQAQEIAFNVDISNPFTAFPQLLDYDNNVILASIDELRECFLLYQKWMMKATPYFSKLLHDGNIRAVKSQASELQTMMSDDYYHITYESFGRLWSIFGVDVYWRSSGLPIYTGNLGNVIDIVAASKAMDENLQMLPFRATDGSVFAEVTYFGAVGKNTNYPDISYELLSTLLGKEFQWDIYRPRRASSSSASIYGKNDDPQNKGLVENSWPVRTKGSIPYLWATYRYQMQGLFNPYVEGLMRASKKLQNKDFILTDEDFPAFEWKIDFVRFPISEPSIDVLLESLKNGEISIDEAAERVMGVLQWHLMEG